jgi:AraC-like DNA-binding protein
MASAERLVETRPAGHGRARGLVSSRASGRRTEAKVFEPPADLSDLVSVFWTGHWDLRGQAPHVTELLGDPCVHFAVETGESQPGSRLVGVWTRLWRRKLEGFGHVRGVKLRAGAVRAFVNVPAHTLANRIVPLESVFGREATGELERDLERHERDEDAFGAFSSWLRLRRLEPQDDDIRLAVELANLIASDPDITTVARLTERSGLGARALQRLFRGHVGASPKWVIRRHRLQEVALRLERGDTVSLARLAAELGYTDQAHLARDFKSAVGKSPSEFAVAVHR